MWLQKSKGKYYWYEFAPANIYNNFESGPFYVRPAKWWEVILNKLFGWQPK